MTQLSDQALSEGAKIGLYEIKDVLHIGQDAITYRAWSHHFNASVVLKEYFPRDIVERSDDGLAVAVANEGEQANFQNGLAGFLELTEALVQIEHANIVQTQNSLEFNGSAYMIMDYLDSESLVQRLETELAFTENDVIKFFNPLLEALQQIHSQGLFHGDVRPDNILLKDDKQPMLVGFSVLSVAELYNSDLQPTPASDLYQLAEVMYQCIRLVKPIALSDRLAAVRKGEQDPLVPLEKTSSLVGNRAVLISIDNMLSLDEQQRPQTATAASAALKASFSEEHAEIADLVLEGNPGSVTTPKPGRLEPALWMSLVGGTVLLLLLTFWILPKEDNKQLLSNTDNTITPIAAIAEQEPETKLVEQQQEAPITEPEQEVTVQTEALQILEQEEVELAQSKVDSNDSKIASTTELDKPAATTTKTKVDSMDNEVVKTSDLSESSSSQSPAVEIVEITEVTDSNEKIAAIAVESVSKTVKDELTETTVTIPDTANAKAAISNWAKVKDLPIPTRIQWHLAEAEKNIAAAQLTTPLEHNAFQHYRIVLVLDPGNTEAKAGMNKIIDYYAILIERALKEDRLYRASIYLRRAEAVRPGAPTIKRLRKQWVEAESIASDIN